MKKSGSSKTNRRPLETDWIFWTFRNSGQNSGQKSTGQNKSTAEQQKALKTNGFQGFDGGDKRDRTADLLNAILIIFDVMNIRNDFLTTITNSITSRPSMQKLKN